MSKENKDYSTSCLPIRAKIQMIHSLERYAWLKEKELSKLKKQDIDQEWIKEYEQRITDLYEAIDKLYSIKECEEID